ncbi:acyltransferase family protein [Pseudoclavibacter endophyticus]|uniref:Acyltransferase n=1 Tax=Pseudoclavibacter endophyticus TaxID=1778590 RepID=A0A6H9WDT7_9MICO|nr:acyltransferase [Pseudoclavibacter endophyticus]KAB1649112.1 acyltransferase [Pseudoclavibacter endophyticus]
MPLTLQQAFDPRANSIGFLRWLMAFAVIFSHSGPLAGFYGGEDLGIQVSSEQSIGGVAVAGFFFFSGFLITKSRMGRSSIFRYFWRRALRIFPAFWLALLTTAFVLAPIAWFQGAGTMDGYWNATNESPFTYFLNNMWLTLGQRNIAEMGQSIPYAEHGGYDWNGSAWTLLYEFRAYIIVGLLGLFGMLANRWIGGAFALGLIVLNAMTWSGMVDMLRISSILDNPFNVMFFAPFAFGMLFALFGDKIPIDDRLAVAALLFAVLAYTTGGWNVWGQYGFLYFVMWFAVRATALRNWEKFGDFSYGIYIFAWPLMQFGAYFGLHETGWFVYHLVIVIAAHLCAFVSWHAIEKPAMSLKNWTPAPLAWALDRLRPLDAAVKRRTVNPDFSTAPYARTLRDARAIVPAASTQSAGDRR